MAEELVSIVDWAIHYFVVNINILAVTNTNVNNARSEGLADISTAPS